VLHAVGRLAAVPGRIVLAVSGGADSMVLLDAAARLPGAATRFVVATFDHGTGPWAREAAAFVAAEARRRGIPVVVGRTNEELRGEAAWRGARWRFLREVARRERARVATAHTRDDQVETVLMRLLRGAGPRGLAALAAPSPVLRPLLALRRSTLRRWAVRHQVSWRDDPSNVDPRHLRNRLRRDLLPALRRVWPGAERELVSLGRRAARWRRDVELVVDRLGVTRTTEGASVATTALHGYSPQELAVLWPAIAARAGVRLDRRGTQRLVEFTSSGMRLARIPLAGGGDVVCLRDRFIVRRRAPRPWAARSLEGVVAVGGWRFAPGAPAVAGEADPERDPWLAVLPADRVLLVRPWRPGDRIVRSGRSTARRVKRFLAEAGIPGPLREGWPVVVAGDEVLWIPGVCRSDAATARPGRPVVAYQCERTHR
jgi:tRNA(Ile)-lysidine synthase